MFEGFPQRGSGGARGVRCPRLPPRGAQPPSRWLHGCSELCQRDRRAGEYAQDEGLRGRRMIRTSWTDLARPRWPAGHVAIRLSTAGVLWYLPAGRVCMAAAVFLRIAVGRAAVTGPAGP